MSASIVIRYSCPSCGLLDSEFSMTARLDGEDIQPFMIRLGDALTVDHSKRSPRCPAPAAKDLKVPIGQGGRVGAPLVN